MQVTMQIPQDLADELKEKSRAKGLSLAAYVRMLLLEKSDEWAKEKRNKK